MTLREALARVRDYGHSAELHAGAGGHYGERGRRVRAASLLTALGPAELDRLAMLTWEHRSRGHTYQPGEALGRIHLYTEGGYADPSPALWIVQRDERAQGASM
jgi:hypothetical protein